ncbi:MAG: hypothetical protein K6B42_05340 [Clostridia bacterium]|nr:hypothetical protein [Clostridia bacterium]
MIFNKKCSKFIAAVLTASMALSPVFVSPISADDGQDVETQASSWRYQDGDIIIDESPDAAEDSDGQLTEDYNAQMGSSEEEQTEEDSVEASAEASDEMTAAAADEAAEIETEEAIEAKSATEKNKYWTISGNKRYGYLKGIDVSYWQHTIDWAKVKSSGIDFAIIRCGYGSNTTSKDDSRFAANVKGCVANGIPYGVYLYSYANTEAGALDEANHALRLLADNGFHPDLPVYYDLEDKTVSKASNATIRKMATVFCNKLTLEGYRAGVYANLSWWNQKLSGFGTYDKWIAQWNSNCTYSGTYYFWQCSSSGAVGGISGRVDADLSMQPKAYMDSFMSGAYTQLASYVTGITAQDYEAYVTASDAAATVAGKKGPGRGYYGTAPFPDGTKVAVTRSANGYLEITDTEGSLGTAWIKSGNLAKGSDPKDFIDSVLYSYDGNVVKNQWVKVRGRTYYVDSEGIALTGRQTIGGKEYYLGADGVEVSNTLATIDGKQYYLGTNGLITKNSFVKIGSYIYGFGQDGVKLTGKKVRLGYKSYILDSQGRAYINKSKTREKTKYYAKPGSGKKGTLKKGKKIYVLRTSGKWSQMANGYWIKTSKTKKTAVYPEYQPDVAVKYKAKLKKKTTSRSGPSNNYIKKKTFKKNKKVTVIGTYGGWAKISSGQWLPLSRLKK